MRSLVGLTLLLTGLGIGAYAYYPQTLERHVNLAKVTRIIAPMASAERIAPSTIADGARQSNSTTSNRNAYTQQRNFSPGSQLLTALHTPRTTSPRETGAIPKPRIAKRNLNSPSKVAATHRAHVGGWHTVVKPAIANKHGSRAMKSSRPADGSARYALVRDTQRELKRVGCYWGKVDGSWGNGTKYAMSQFVKNVNATLPTNDPDYILLSLVRAQPGQICGVSQDKAIVASADPQRKRLEHIPYPRRATPTVRHTRTAALPQASIAVPVPTPAKRTSAASRKTPVRPLPGRMAVGGPSPHQQHATYTAPNAPSVPATTHYQTNQKVIGASTYKQKRIAKRNTPADLNTSQTPAIYGTAPLAAKKIKRQRALTSKKRSKRSVRVSSKSKSKKKRRYRRRAKNPLANLLRQGVY